MLYYMDEKIFETIQKHGIWMKRR